MSEWALLGLAFTLAATGAAWRWPWKPGVSHGRRRLCWPLLSAGGLAAAATSAILAAPNPGLLAVGHLVAALCGVLGGGPITAALLNVAPDGSTRSPAAQVLRAGATIGLLERVAVVMTLQAGWPEGVAVAMAIKALGRYPELRQPGTSERFIVGTFASVLWAAACSGIVYIS